MSSQNDLDRELLISEIQTRPALWNDRHPSHKNRNYVLKLWEEVAQIVGVSGKTIKDSKQYCRLYFSITLYCVQGLFIIFR